MEKSIKCLKEEISKLRGYAVIIDGEDGEWEPVTTVSVEDIYELINQLGKPEALSQAWIYEHKKTFMEDGKIYNTVLSDDLQNLLVPNQKITEEQVSEYLRERSMTAVDSTLVHRENLDSKIVTEIPTIPEFVAEFLDGKEDYTLYELLDNEWIYNNHDELARWLYNNDEKTNKEREINLVLAQRYDYQVEKEQKFYVLNENKQLMLKKHEGEVKSAYNSLRGVGENYLTFYQLTEQEIKDYDERYFAFAKPVEEVEE